MAARDAADAAGGVRRSAWRHWRGRLIGALVLLTLLVLAGLAVETYISYRRTATALVLERDRQAAYLSAIRLRDELTKYADDLAETARTRDGAGDGWGRTTQPRDAVSS